MVFAVLETCEGDVSEDSRGRVYVLADGKRIFKYWVLVLVHWYHVGVGLERAIMRPRRLDRERVWRGGGGGGREGALILMYWEGLSTYSELSLREA